ncbi:hypothetical protein CHLRE_06g296100v5 [Chlamydomonas reinhardtii]|uniref:Uncharacterized protein n=1 Tax=Chlamydomonas reinhardtii TaxID=3055 RepID=A0A2K3DQK6_CHLRE|nr:uncharacterized protein CHLRE_06g296100v5 [Chlamydomonas reinhardtii]PNW82826.1 hypothetical protein CHLRE_06g296100v5 [Chlamydomonas reinhardtii]
MATQPHTTVAIALLGALLALAASPALASYRMPPAKSYMHRPPPAKKMSESKVEHVVLLSIDGLHSGDLTWWLANRPMSALAKLAMSGVVYPQAFVKGITDSFPGVLALLTGGSSKSHGVYYDDSYSRDLWCPGTPCNGSKPTGPPGCELVLDESLDYNLSDPNGGRTGINGDSINPANLPLDKDCKPVYPHQLLTANTIFEVAKSAGLRTAWTDKHPAYDLVQGPSGMGVDQLYTPEINTDYMGLDYTHVAEQIPKYDALHAEAISSWALGFDYQGNPQSGWGVPAIFGGNFQTVSVVAKLYSPVAYEADGMTPAASMLTALEEVDGFVGRIAAYVDVAGRTPNTAFIVTAKHGNAPRKASDLQLLPDTLVPNALKAAGVMPAQVTQDTVSLIWLEDASQIAAAVKALEANATALGIAEVIYGPALLEFAGDPATSPTAPHIVTRVIPGVVYVGNPAKHSKAGDHGGLNDDDNHVALLVSKSGQKPMTVTDRVETRQVAPTVLKLLGLDHTKLTACMTEGCDPLPGLSY